MIVENELHFPASFISNLPDPYRLVAEVCSDSTLIAQVNGKLEYITPGIAECLGIHIAADAGPAEETLAGGPHGSLVMEMIRKAAETRKSSVEEIQSRVGGKTRWFNLKIVPVLDGSGPPALFLGIAQDISHQRQAVEQNQRDGERLFRGFIDHSPEGFLLVDENGQLAEWNPVMEELTGWQKSEVMGLPLQDIPLSAYRPEDTAPISLQQVWDEVCAQMNPGRERPFWIPREAALLNRNGQSAPVEIQAFLIPGEAGCQVGLIVRDIGRQVKYESDMETSLSLLRATLESTADGILAVEADGVTVATYNLRFLDMWGFRGPLRSLNELNADHRVLRPLVNPLGFIQKLAELGMDTSRESYDLIEFADGRVFESHSIPRWVNGRSAGRVWSFRDITDRVRVEQALRASEARFQAVFHDAGIGIMISDLEGRLVQNNAAIQRVLGYSAEDLYRLGICGITHPDDVEVNLSLQKEMIQGKRDLFHLEKRYLHKDGTIVWGRLTSTLVRDTDGKPLFVIGMVENITDWVRDHQALQVSEERYRQLFDHSPVGVLEIRASHPHPVILRANQRVAELFGWSTEELTGAPLQMLIPMPPVAAHESFQQSVRAGKTIHMESTCLRKDGEAVPVRISATPESSQDPINLIFTIEDIGLEKHRRTEEQAISAERQRIARDIHDGIAQDLLSISMRVGLWHDLVDQDSAQMHAELERLKELIRTNVRDIRRSIFALRPVALEELGFMPALRQFLHDFGEYNQLGIDLEVSGSLSELASPLEAVVFRIIQESLNNIAKHAQASHARVSLEVNAPDYARICIDDNGVGFETSTLSQAVLNGHLGLKQMRERVELLRGSFQLSSQPGQGTRLSVTLPLIKTI